MEGGSCYKHQRRPAGCWRCASRPRQVLHQSWSSQCRGSWPISQTYPRPWAFHLKSNTESVRTHSVLTRCHEIKSIATRSTLTWSTCHKISCELIWWQLILILWHRVKLLRVHSLNLPRLCLHFRELFNLKYPVTVDSFVTLIRSQSS